MTVLLQKDTTFEWGSQAEEAFQNLKEALCTAPVLQFPDLNKPYIITTDTSGIALGGILSQGPIGKDRPIAYTSRVLRGPELNYQVYELEALAVLHGVKKFRSYVYGRKLTIVTDCEALTWFKTATLNSRVQKWRFKLSEYDYEILYKPGKRNTNADALSRNIPNEARINAVTRGQARKEMEERNGAAAPQNEPKIVEASPGPVMARGRGRPKKLPPPVEEVIDLEAELAPVHPSEGLNNATQPKRRGRPPKVRAPLPSVARDEFMGKAADDEDEEPLPEGADSEADAYRTRAPSIERNLILNSEPEERGSARALPSMRQPEIFTEKEKTIATSEIGSLPSVRETVKDYEDGLSCLSESNKIIDVPDYIHGYGGNVACFVSSNGQPLDAGAKMLQSQGKIPTDMDMATGQIHEFSNQKGKKYFVVCLENADNPCSLHVTRTGIYRSLVILRD